MGEPAAAQIVMVGLMGAGKSAIGRRLASRLGMPFLDADGEIEAAAGMTVSDIFKTHGEAEFRKGELKVMTRLLDGSPKILATGGGAFMDDTVRGLIKENAVSVWLKADLDTLVERTSRRNHRPILKQDDPRQILAQLIDERYPVYAQSDITVESTDCPPEETVEDVAATLDAYFSDARHIAGQGGGS